MTCSDRSARRWALLPTLLLLAAAGNTPAVDITIDGTATDQTIAGFGTCEAHWTAGAQLANPEVRRLWTDDLRASILRFGIPNAILPKPVDDPAAIRYQDFTFSPGDAHGLDFVEAIHRRDPHVLVFGTAWSPPGWMKTNGKAGGGGALREDRGEHYAAFLTQLVKYMQEVRHVPIYGISPQNELEFKEFYDSCIYKPPHYAAVVGLIARAFEQAKLSTVLIGPEDMTDFADRDAAFVRAIEANPDAKRGFQVIATHGYVDGVLSAGSADGHHKLYQLLHGLGLPFWMTETSGEGPAWNPIVKGKPRAGALTLATKIHNALVYGHCSAWVYWCFVGNTKAGGGSAAGESLVDMTKPTKKYFVSKQYYRWIRPGAVRIEATPDGQEGVLVSAYHHPSGATTIVLINHGDAAQDAHLALTHLDAPLFHAWRTSAEEDTAAQPDVTVHDHHATVTLPPLTVTTLTTYREADVMLAPDGVQAH